MTKQKRALCFGVLINSLTGYYNRVLLDALRKRAKHEGINLVIFPGHELDERFDLGRQHNVTYDMASSTHIDGIISVTACYHNHLSRNDSIAFLGRYGSVPLVNLNFEMPGCPAVSIDNRTGLRELLHHLIQDHGYTRLAFMTGPAGNADSDGRFDVYTECLAEAGLPYSEQLVVCGNFLHIDAREAMQQLLDRNLEIEVLVVANDGMAKAAMEVAVERRLRIPEDIAITGFDDILSVIKEGPPITTVSQPIALQANVVFDVLLDQLKEKQLPLTIVLPTHSVIRQSCGCVVVWLCGQNLG